MEKGEDLGDEKAKTLSVIWEKSNSLLNGFLLCGYTASSFI